VYRSPSAGSRTSPRAPQDAGKSPSAKKRHGGESRASARRTAARSRGWLPAIRLSLGREKTLRNKRLCNAQRSNLRLTSATEIPLHPLHLANRLDLQGDRPPPSHRKASRIPPAANVLQQRAGSNHCKEAGEEANPAPSAGQRCVQVPPRSPAENPSRFVTHIATAGPGQSQQSFTAIASQQKPSLKFYRQAAFYNPVLKARSI